MKRFLFTFILLVAILFPTRTKAETEPTDTVTYTVETVATISSGRYTPFWLTANRGGLGSPRLNNGYLRAAAEKKMDWESRFSWGAGLDLVGAWKSWSPFRIRQLYGEIRYRSLSAFAGSKLIEPEMTDPLLSSGNLLYSGNALPIPQVRAGIKDFVPVWGTNGWFSVKGYIAYGKFTDSRWQKNWVAPDSLRTSGVLYHSKGLWMRGGNPDRFPLTGTFGIEMGTQFGGESHHNGETIKMGHGLEKWLKAFFPSPSDASAVHGERTNVEGNFIGSYYFQMEWAPKSGPRAKVYYQHLFDDHSQMFFQYGPWKDGLWGVQIYLPKNRWISSAVYEFLYTKDQTGAVYHDSTEWVPEQVSGRDCYYDHFLYAGWQNRGLGIGSPLAISPIFNSDHTLFFYDTRIVAHHLGISGNPTENLDYRLLLTATSNWGTYMHPLPEVEHNFSAMAEVGWHLSRLPGWSLKGSVAFDRGQLLGNNFGLLISISKSGRIF